MSNKPSPLKGKEYACWNIGTLYKDKDIRSAVEWLKSKACPAKKYGNTCIECDGWLRDIDKAFEDVMK